MKKNILILFIILSPFIASSQAIRCNYFGCSIFEKQGNKFFFWGFGYEHNLGEKIAVSLEYNKGYTFDEDPHTEQIEFPDNFGSSNVIYYSTLMPWSEFSYQSKYFFTGTDDDSWYVSTGVAVRNVKFEVNDISTSGTLPITLPTKPSESITLIPISLKLGYRNSIDGWFQDYSFGVSFIPGGSSKKSGITFIDTYNNKTLFNNLAFNFCMSFGLGWAD